MFRSFRIMLAFLFAVIGFSDPAPASSTKPNIIVFLADDLGWHDVGYHGGEIRTPHIDAMAKQGIELDRFYTQPTCTPTRIALMTGRYPYRVGGQTCVLRSYHQHGVSLTEVFLSEKMQAAGYKTAIVGKWHLGLARKAYWPTARGFDLHYGCLGGAIDYFSHLGYGTLDWNENQNIPLHEEGYATDLIGAKAEEIIKGHDFTSQPLFLYVPFNAPHVPIQAKAEDIAAYVHIHDPKRRTYAAMVTAMDRQIGNIVQAVKDKGVINDTLVFFASDNGGHSDGSNNTPLRRGKGTLYEGGIRVPAILSWPARLEGSKKFSKPLHIVDLFPTFARLASIALDNKVTLDGIDFWPALAENNPLPQRDLFHNISDKSGRGAIRSGAWKLIVSRAAKAKVGVPLNNPKLVAELFHIEQDPIEQHNLADQYPDLVDFLWAKLKARAGEVGNSRPYCARAPEGWQPPADWSGVPN